MQKHVLEAHWDGSVLWASDNGYSVWVDLKGKLPQAMLCNCSDRFKPCNHAMALVWLAKTKPDALKEREMPKWQKDEARYDPTWE